ncbi:MAG TPA: hypothetical protein VHW69_08515 [Rhizomicrobium sp.]|jgi:hypothetical protein|nr:hypothetical protein [Rhizomicrobium sp.]
MAVVRRYTRIWFVVFAGFSLGSCALVESDQPIFNFSDVTLVPGLAGVYEMAEGGVVVIQARRKSYRAIALKKLNNEYVAELTLDFDIIRLDRDDLAIQLRCMASRDDKHPSKWERFSRRTIYGVAAAARVHGSYWFGFIYPAAISPALARKHHIEPEITNFPWDSKSPKTETVSDVTIRKGTSSSEVKAFLIDWKNALLAAGSDSMQPVWRQSSELDTSARAAVTSAPECSSLPPAKSQL